MFPQRRDGGRPAAVVYCVCAVYLYCVGSLLVWACVPVLTGMTPTLILSGSMGPRINAGDVVLMGAPAGHTIEAGSVIAFDDPGHEGRLLTHRVTFVKSDGTYRTRGDANTQADSAPVTPDRVRGVGRMLVPAAGVPLMWVRSHAWLQLLLWLGGSALALGYLRAYPRRLPLVSAWSTPLRIPKGERRPSRPAPDDAPSWDHPVISRWRLRWAMPALLVLVLVAVALPRMVASHATITAATTNPDNAWAAGTDFCPSGPQTLNPTADARITEGSGTPEGSATTIGITSKNPAAKSLLTFDVPAAVGCTLTSASLRVQVQGGVAGRTLHAHGLAAPWNESTVVWANQPGVTAAAAATAPSSATVGAWVTFTVTTHVDAMRAGTAHGLLIQDSTTGGAAATQTFHSREAAGGQPQLVLNFTADPPPAAPSGLSATALSATRIDLDWTDTSGGVAGFRIERSPAGAASWTTVDTVAAGTTTYTDTGLEPSTAYDYRVRATSSSGVSDPSNVASATTPAPPPPPAAPSGLMATATGVDTVDVSWTDNSADEDGFVVQRSPAGAGTWTEAGTVALDVTAFGDTNLTAGTSYDYRVRAFNEGGDSDWSAVATATTDGCALAPAQTLTSIGDSLVLQAAPTTNYGSDGVNFGIRSWANSNGRSLVRFDAPTLSGGCAITGATLRVYETSGDVGRTIEALQVAAAWTESTVTWNNQPGTAGTAATTTSAVGWNEWDVTTLVGATGAGAPDGFLLRDAVEDAVDPLRQYYSPREGSDPPQLVITFD